MSDRHEDRPDLEPRLLRVAQEKAGRLTASEAALALDLPFDEVNEALAEPAAKDACRTLVTEEKVVVYYFPEFENPATKRHDITERQIRFLAFFALLCALCAKSGPSEPGPHANCAAILGPFSTPVKPGQSGRRMSRLGSAGLHPGEGGRWQARTTAERRSWGGVTGREPAHGG